MLQSCTRRKRILGQLPFERLEDRRVLTSLGVPWPEAADLTLSFAPDGTPAGSETSQLFQTLNQSQSPQDWQLEILRAFQTWAVESNLNIGLVSDGAQPFGTLGLKQGDPRFGDVRVGALPLGNDTLAVTIPYDPFVANTWVGDVLFNSSYQFGTSNTEALNDLFSVALHEAGHVFGLGHSSDPNSPMYESLNLVHSGLTQDDIATLQSIYGTRLPDSFDAVHSNDSLATASPLSLIAADGLPDSADADADLTTLTDTDDYSVVVPKGVQSLTFTIQAAGESLVVPGLTIYDATGNLVSSTQALDPLHNDITLTVEHPKAGEIYYAKVDSTSDDVFGIGQYTLHVIPQLDAATAAKIANLNSTPGATPVSSTAAGSSFSNFQLLATTPGYVEHTYYETDGSLNLALPEQTYRVRSTDLGPDMTNVMTVSLSQAGDANADLSVDIFDAQGQRVESHIVSDLNGTLEIQVPDVQSNADYFVRVSGTQLAERPTEFDLTADFDRDADHLESFIGDQLDQSQPTFSQVLQVNQSQEFHFVLSATDWNTLADTGVVLSITNAAGQTVQTISVADGATRSLDVFLSQGQYAFGFARQNNSSTAPLLFHLSGTGLSEPVGPQLQDTTLRPVDAEATISSQLAFYWLPFAAPDVSKGMTSLSQTPVNFNQNGTGPGTSNSSTGQAASINGLVAATSNAASATRSLWSGPSQSTLVGVGKVRLTGRPVEDPLTSFLTRPRETDRPAPKFGAANIADLDLGEILDESFEATKTAHDVFTHTGAVPFKMQNADPLESRGTTAQSPHHFNDATPSASIHSPLLDPSSAASDVLDAQYRYWIAACGTVALGWLIRQSWRSQLKVEALKHRVRQRSDLQVRNPSNAP
jgi:hypothetical protein